MEYLEKQVKAKFRFVTSLLFYSFLVTPSLYCSVTSIVHVAGE
jgi:hypothetical protein